MAEKLAKAAVGRPGANSALRQLLVLIASLQQAGDRIDRDVLAQQLRTEDRDGEFLIWALQELRLPDESRLPLLVDEEGLELIEDSGVGTVRLRHTRSETYASLHALSRIGADKESRFYKLVESFASDNADLAAADRLLGSGSTEQVDTALFSLSQAIIHRRRVSFLYQGVSDSAPGERSVEPVALERYKSHWYLRAWDLDRSDMRSFRLERMAELRTRGDLQTQVPCAESRAFGEGAPRQKLRFLDASVLELLEWPGIACEQRDDGSIVATLPDYGGDWLPRQLLACGNTVEIADASLRRAVEQQADKLIAFHEKAARAWQKVPSGSSD